MFLNDAFDQDFDRRYRPERPIVSGLVRPYTVWMLSFAWLGIGWAIFLWLGTASAVIAILLVAAIVLYDWIHKRTVLSPLLMACCRFLLYLLAGVGASGVRDSVLLWCAGALGAYIVGLSYLARGESTGLRFWSWTIVLLFVPAIVALFLRTNIPASTLLTVVAVQVGWTLWCLWKGKPGILSALPQGVAGLLAGIALVDWLAAAGCGWAGAFLLLFGAALILQKVAPAT
jgi:4-hydroxybenzoate polyprenyltransferase